MSGSSIYKRVIASGAAIPNSIPINYRRSFTMRPELKAGWPAFVLSATVYIPHSVFPLSLSIACFMLSAFPFLSHPLIMIVATNEGGTKHVRQRRNDIRGALLLDHGDNVPADTRGFHNGGAAADSRMKGKRSRK